MCMYNWFTLLYSAITLSLQLSQHCKLTVCQLNKQANVTAYHLELLRKKLPWLLTGSQYIWESALIFLYLYLLHWLLLFSHSVVSDSVTPWTAACQASLLFTISWSLLKLMPTELVMPSNYLIICHPLLLLPSIFPSIKFFSNALHIRWPKYWSLSFSISPSNECSELISFRIDWFDHLAVQGTLKNLKHQFFSAQPFLW